MAKLYSKFSKPFFLTLLIVFGVVSYYLMNQTVAFWIPVLILGLISLVFAWFDLAPIFLLIFLSFSTSYALYGFLFQYGLPIWLVMLIILVLFGFLFLYTEQKIGILGNKRLIYLVLFSLIVLEVFLTLNFFLISPISKSLIISTVSYVFVGFDYTILAKHTDNSFKTYLLIAGLAIALIFITSVWGI